MPMAVEAAARELGIRPGTLRRWVREGCPIVQRGRRGRGLALVVDVAAVRLWREASERDAAILELAGLVPEVLAAQLHEAWRLAEGMDKRRLAAVLAGGWYLAASGVLDRLRERNCAVPEIEALPEAIGRLQKIARG